ncbi:MAG: hypothetical protein JOZ45_18565 [Acidobacteriaceae bacterium]|nr:hypothetical protein [Acidobacteriaceae bacterium]
MSFPKMGKTIPIPRGAFARMIALSLRTSLGGSRAAIKTAAAWTGANERTVKNWFAGRAGPSGDHFAGLVLHSDVVLNEFLQLTGRRPGVSGLQIMEAIEVMRGALGTLERLTNEVGSGLK